MANTTSSKARKRSKSPSWDELREMMRNTQKFIDQTILLAVAAINYDREAKQHALQEGLLVITASDNDIFSLECPDESRLKKL